MRGKGEGIKESRYPPPWRAPATARNLGEPLSTAYAFRPQRFTSTIAETAIAPDGPEEVGHKPGDFPVAAD
jgi:hypothetical protein